MEAIKVTLTLCLAAMGSDSDMEKHLTKLREAYPKAKLTLTAKPCDKSGKAIKGKKVTYTD